MNRGILGRMAMLLALAGLGWIAGGERVALDPGDAWGWDGFYPPESDSAGRSFRWSRPRALVHFRGLDRRSGLRVELELRGWRPPGAGRPHLEIEADGMTIWRGPLGADWETISLGLGPAAGGERDHLDLLLAAEPFRPSDLSSGSSDSRTLGVQVRRVVLRAPSRRAEWLALSAGAGAGAMALLHLGGAAAPLALAGTAACSLGALWVAAAAARPYALDALPPWTPHALRLGLVALVLAPLLLSPRWGRRRRLLGALALGATVFAVHAPALGNGFFWDDFDFVRPITASEWLFTFYGTWNWTGIGNDYYRPLVITLFQLDYLGYGLRPEGFHLTNLLLHAANAVLLGSLLSRWLRRRWALAGAALFAAHPMTATGLGWISQRTDVLCTTFYLLAIVAVDRFLRRPAPAGLLPVGAAYAAALGSKEIAASFPGAALAYAAVLRSPRRAVLRMGAVLALVSLVYAVGWLTIFGEKLRDVNVLSHASGGVSSTLRPVLRLLAFTFTPAYYPSYDFERLQAESWVYLVFGSAVFILAGLGVILRGRGRERWLFLFGGAWLLITVVPLFNIRYPDYIRLGYLPAAGAAISAAAVLSWLARARSRWLAAGLTVLFLGWTAPIDQKILSDWSHGGRIAGMINPSKAGDPEWRERIGPERLAVFEAQRQRVRWEREHVQRLLGLSPRLAPPP